MNFSQPEITVSVSKKNKKANHFFYFVSSIAIIAPRLPTSPPITMEVIGHVDLKPFFSKMKELHYPDEQECALDVFLATHVKPAVVAFVEEIGQFRLSSDFHH